MSTLLGALAADQLYDRFHRSFLPSEHPSPAWSALPIYNDVKVFGVFTGIAEMGRAPLNLAVLRTADGLTHHIRIIQHTSKWLRYVLRHDQKAYLLVNTGVEALDTPVTCVICIAKGPERTLEI
jgi:hypothetical protein